MQNFLQSVQLPFPVTDPLAAQVPSPPLPFELTSQLAFPAGGPTPAQVPSAPPPLKLTSEKSQGDASNLIPNRLAALYIKQSKAAEEMQRWDLALEDANRV